MSSENPQSRTVHRLVLCPQRETTSSLPGRFQSVYLVRASIPGQVSLRKPSAAQSSGLEKSVFLAINIIRTCKTKPRTIRGDHPHGGVAFQRHTPSQALCSKNTTALQETRAPLRWVQETNRSHTAFRTAKFLTPRSYFIAGCPTPCLASSLLWGIFAPRLPLPPPQAK